MTEIIVENDCGYSLGGRDRARTRGPLLANVRKRKEWLCSNRVAVRANGLHRFTPAPDLHLFHDSVNVVPDRILR